MVAGVALLFAGRPVVGALLFVAGMALEALAGLVSFTRGALDTVRQWAPIITGGVPKAARVVSVTPPSSVIFNPEASIVVELTGKDGHTATVEREVPVPRLAALGWKLTRITPWKTPERFDFERQLELELRREAEEGVDSLGSPHGDAGAGSGDG
jgi:hypothetical protein